MDLISKEAIKKYISAPCTYVEGRRIFYEEDLDLMGSAFEGMTNRDVLKALFPIDENKGSRFTKVYLDHESTESFELLITKKWLDSPYKGVSDEF